MPKRRGLYCSQKESAKNEVHPFRWKQSLSTVFVRPLAHQLSKEPEIFLLRHLENGGTLVKPLHCEQWYETSAGRSQP